MGKLILCLLLLLAFCKAEAQDKRFPTDVAVETQAIFCIDKKDAQVIADAKGELTDEVKDILVDEKCALLQGVAVYVREVYRNGDWAVWELRSGNIPAFYEATNWKPIPKGIEI